MSKKTQKTKMSLQELAAMRGVERHEAGCTFDAELVPRDYEAEAKASAAEKAAEEAETQARIAALAAKKEAETQARRAALIESRSKESGLELFYTKVAGCREEWWLFAVGADGVPFFFCQRTDDGDYLVPDVEGISLNAYAGVDGFFTSPEVANLPLDEAVELWRSTGHYSRHWVMNCYKEGRGRTVIQVLNNIYPASEPASDWHWNDRDA